MKNVSIYLRNPLFESSDPSDPVPPRTSIVEGKITDRPAGFIEVETTRMLDDTGRELSSSKLLLQIPLAKIDHIRVHGDDMRTTTVLASLLLTACGGPSVNGTVTDVSGDGLEGATVTVVGTVHQGKSKTDGAFDVDARTGSYQVIIAQQGYISKEFDLDIAESKAYDLGQVVLIKIPETNGVFLFDGASYTTMASSRLERLLEGEPSEPTRKSYCLDTELSTPNEVKAGSVPLFTKSYEFDWRLFALDEDGCARHMSREGHKWTIDYSEKPEMTERDVGAEQKVSIVDMAPGSYFIADWHAGTFVEKKDEEEEGGPKLFSGFLIVAK